MKKTLLPGNFAIGLKNGGRARFGAFVVVLLVVVFVVALVVVVGLRVVVLTTNFVDVVG